MQNDFNPPSETMHEKQINKSQSTRVATKNHIYSLKLLNRKKEIR